MPQHDCDAEKKFRYDKKLIIPLIQNKRKVVKSALYAFKVYNESRADLTLFHCFRKLQALFTENC
jgi:hypothetical protein